MFACIMLALCIEINVNKAGEIPGGQEMESQIAEHGYQVTGSSNTQAKTKSETSLSSLK